MLCSRMSSVRTPRLIKSFSRFFISHMNTGSHFSTFEPKRQGPITSIRAALELTMTVDCTQIYLRQHALTPNLAARSTLKSF